MQTNLDLRLQALNRDNLTPLVSQVLQHEPITLADWQVTRMQGGTFGLLYHLTGTAQSAAATLPWSLVLKVVHNRSDVPIARSDPANLRYWKREPLIYQSGFLADLPGNVVAPRCFGVVEQAEDEIWLWLEDVKEAATAAHTAWSLDQYRLAARHLGQFNGGFLTTRPLPAAPAFGRRLLHQQFVEAATFMAALPTQLDHPLVRCLLPPDVVEGLFHLWTEQASLLAMVERVPQTVCHRDTFRVNLFPSHNAQGEAQTLAIDWEDVAIGPVGEDIVSLVVLGLGYKDVELSAAQAFEAHLFTSYLAGLQDSGWTGKPHLVRLGYTSAMIRYALGLPQVFLPRFVNHEESIQPELESTASHWGKVLRFVYARIAEAFDGAQDTAPSVNDVSLLLA